MYRTFFDHVTVANGPLELPVISPTLYTNTNAMIHQATKIMLKSVIIGGTRKTDLTSATNNAALLMIAIAYLILLKMHKKIIKHRPVNPKMQ